MELNVFRALDHPDRVRIIDLLATRERTVNELAASLGIGQSSVSKHLALMLAARLVRFEPHGVSRTYRLNRSALIEVSSWANAAATRLEKQEEEAREFKMHARDYSRFEEGFAFA